MHFYFSHSGHDHGHQATEQTTDGFLIAAIIMTSLAAVLMFAAAYFISKRWGAKKSEMTSKTSKSISNKKKKDPAEDA